METKPNVARRSKLSNISILVGIFGAHQDIKNKNKIILMATSQLLS